MPPFRQRVIYGLETLLARLLLGFFDLLPLAAASSVGGAIARTIGPHLGITKRARRKLARALPELDAAAQDRVLLKMWDNLGRVAAEIPHLPRINILTPDSPLEITGLDGLAAARATGRPLILFSGHLGNWELLNTAATRVDLPMTVLYRSPNNPGVERLLASYRREGGAEPVPKTKSGARRVVTALREGRGLGILADQKMNEGMAVPFFGRPAMTATVAADLALRYRALLIPVRCRRVAGAHFRIDCETPYDPHADPGNVPSVYELLVWINSRLEEWIRDDPGQWFWLHNRWPD